jgi:glyoxylase-like metal-dependent hydrolase (beta-lactamase superfamily II)
LRFAVAQLVVHRICAKILALSSIEIAERLRSNGQMIRAEQIGLVRKFSIARTMLGRNLYFTAAYLVDGLMVDTGCAHTVREFTQALVGSHVQLIANTHSHEDHIGANAALQSTFDAQILAHRDALPYLADPRLRPLHPYQRVVWGYPAPSTGLALGNQLETEQFRFEVIHTPGHSPDHVCLYEPTQGWLFAGDAYVGGRDKALRRDYNVWQIINSLKKLARLDAQFIFPGSGTVRDNPKETLRTKISYLEETGERVLGLRARGLSYRSISRQLFGPEMLIAYYTLGHFSGRNLVRSYIEDEQFSC